MSANPEENPAKYFNQWIEEARRNQQLRAKIDELEAEVLTLREQVSQSVPKMHAERVVKGAYVQGQLKGKTALEASLVFPWPPERTVPFSEMKAAYLKSLTHRAEGGTKRPPTPKTLLEYERTLDLFVKVMGDLRIGAIDREKAGAYFSTLRKIPANIEKIAKYRGKSIAELIAMNDPPQSETTCSKKIERVSTMFKWALEEKRKWGIDANPFIGYGQADDSSTTRRPFTEEELRTLLNHPDFTSRRFSNSYAYWLIPLALYTGARLGELAQLDLKDFVEVEGIACIDINDTDAAEVVEVGGRRKRVKTKNARRLVPIHPELLRIGILRYVDQLRRSGAQVHLFPELSRTRRDGPAHAASNWFGRFRKRVGIEAKQEAVFHSFRHLFITNILDAEVSPHMLAPIVGHEAELVTGQVYWNKKDATKRFPTVATFKVKEDVAALIPCVEDVMFADGAQRKGRV